MPRKVRQPPPGASQPPSRDREQPSRIRQPPPYGAAQRYGRPRRGTGRDTAILTAGLVVFLSGLYLFHMTLFMTIIGSRTAPPWLDASLFVLLAGALLLLYPKRLNYRLPLLAFLLLLLAADAMFIHETFLPDAKEMGEDMRENEADPMFAGGFDPSDVDHEYFGNMMLGVAAASIIGAVLLIALFLSRLRTGGPESPPPPTRESGGKDPGEPDEGEGAASEEYPEEEAPREDVERKAHDGERKSRNRGEGHGREAEKGARRRKRGHGRDKKEARGRRGEGR